MINAVGSSISPNFGRKSQLEKDVSRAYGKFEDVVSDVADDNDKLGKEDVLKGGVAGAAGLGAVKAGRALKAVNKGGDIVQLTSKAVTKKGSKFLQHPILKKLGPIGAILATGLAIGETANVGVNLINHPTEN